jgi:hypothetical protein
LLVVIASITIAKLGVLVSTIVLMMIAVVVSHVQPDAPALVGEMVQLARVLLLQLLAYLASCFCANLPNLMAL